MTRLRISCRAPAPSSIGGRSASLEDVTVVLVADDGTETPVTNIERIDWCAVQNEPTRAVVRFVDVELETELELVAGSLVDEDTTRCEACREVVPDGDGVEFCPKCWADLQDEPAESEQA